MDAERDSEVMGDRESMLEHECERLRQENARLRSEVDRLRGPRSLRLSPDEWTSYWASLAQDVTPTAARPR